MTHENARVKPGEQHQQDALGASPAPPMDVRDQPHALTVFMTGRERLAVLRRLRRIDGDRRVALLTVLGLMDGPWAAPPDGPGGMGRA